MLELGLGHGYSTRYFADAFDHYTVIEGSMEMIRRFQDKNPIDNINIELSFFEDFETDQRFDAIGMGFVLEHVDDPSLIVRRYARFLAPDGLLFIAVPNAESLHRRIGHEAGLLPDMTTLSDADRDFGHQRYFTCETLRQVVEDEGLAINNIEGLLLKPFTTQQITQLNLSGPILHALLKVGVSYPELANSILLTARLSENGIDDRHAVIWPEVSPLRAGQPT
jgi:2-polyprenyl-3-methyl-5-hydroxy-6-metoxy-1,4-benzoquinol methylase